MKLVHLRLSKDAEVKIIQNSIFWLIQGRRFVKHIPFAWIIGDSNYVAKLNSFTNAESDFYSILFNSLYIIAMKSFSILTTTYLCLQEKS